MRRSRILAIVMAGAVAAATCGRPAGTLESAAETLGSNDVRSIEFIGTGKWYQFGQSPSAESPWPPFDVSNYTVSMNYDISSARVQMTRKQTIEPGRTRPAPVEQRPDQYVSGSSAWNLAPAPGAPAGSAPTPQPQAAAVEERVMEIWTTPHGFLRAAAANNATVQPVNEGSEVSFTVGGKYRFIGTINRQNEITRVHTWIDNPVLGDTPVEFSYSEYREFNGVRFPSRVVRTQGGYPVLEIQVSSVTANPRVDLAVPSGIDAATVPPVAATIEPLAPGVHYVRGGGHHSVAIDQQDHVVVVEAPLNEARSLAVIAKVKETIPNKPIRYVINSHHHFDHSGGLRTFVDEGATIVTHQSNRGFYEKAWAGPRTLNPDRLSQSKKAAAFETFADKHVLSDGKRSIEIHRLVGNGHNDGFAIVYLPAEKILIEVDAWAPLAAGAAPPAAPSPFAVNLHDNIQRLKLDVRQIAALHGPRVATMGEFQAAIGQAPSGTR